MFQLVERNLARPQRTFQHLLAKPAGNAAHDLLGHAFELDNQVAVVAGLLDLAALELFEQHLDPVDGGKHERDGLAGHRHAVAELIHQRFGGVGERFEPGQVEKAAGALDGVDQAEDVVENLGVVGLLLKTHQLDVDDIDAFVRFGEKFTQQVVHGARFLTQRPAAVPAQFGSFATVLANGLIFVAPPRFSGPR